MAALQDFLSLLQGVKSNGKGFVARCPAHDDRQQSLAVSEGEDGRILVNCFAGCEARDIVAAVGLTMRDLFPDTKSTKTGQLPTGDQAITVEDLAADKGLPAEWLREFVEPMPFGVKIIYRLSNGAPAPRQRLRIALSAKEGSRWTKGNGKPILYGSWRNKEMAGKSDSVVFVEGESDAWTCWFHGIAALGVPGADMTGKLKKGHVAPYKRVYLWKEPDKGGRTFVDGLTRQLAALDYAGEVFVVQGPPREDGRPVKDPNALHKETLRQPGLFAEQWAAVLSAAEPVELPALKADAKHPGSAPGPDQLDPETLYNNLTDMGNADRLVRLFGQDILYCYAWNTWLVWNGRYWEKDATGEIDRKAEATARSIYAEAANEMDREARGDLIAHARKSEAVYKIKAMIDRAKNRRPAVPEQFDNDIWLLNVQNGTLDLRTGELRPHSRDDHATKCSPAAYDAAAQAPTWHKFLERVTGGDAELQAFLQRAAGYALTGDVSEHCLFFLHGDGRNGKSVFIDTLQYVLGDYGTSARPEILMAKQYGDNIPNEIAALAGVRYVSTIETGSGKRMAEAMLKQYTGGDTISARFLHAEFFTFRPQFKIWLASNHKPVIRGQDTAIWERIHLIPFTVYIPPEERDKQLSKKLQAEADGILAWAIQGCLAWQRGGLRPPDAVRAATQEYREEMDVLADFLVDRCILQPGVSVGNAALWSEYVDWCKHNAERYPLNRRAFKENLERRGLSQLRKGTRYWSGIGLLTGATQTRFESYDEPISGKVLNDVNGNRTIFDEDEPY